MPLRLLLAGDVMTGRGIDQVLPHPAPPHLLESWVRDARKYVRLAEEVSGPIPRGVPPEYVWGDALQVLRAADVRIANLETAVTMAEDAWPAKGIHYRMAPRNVPCLAAAGWNALSLANNHVLDWGRAGLAETLSALEAAGVQAAGAGSDREQACGTVRVPSGRRPGVLLSAWAAASSGVPPDWAAGPGLPGLALLPDLSEDSAREIAGRIAAVRRAGDISVVSLHWGGNWVPALPPAHRAFARLLVDLGAADVVHGHSSHHPLGIEIHRGRAILYGCGDLLNDYEGIQPHDGLRSDRACLYRLDLADGGTLQALEITPLRIRRFRLESADAATREELRALFVHAGRELGTAVAPLSGGGFALHWQ